MPPVKFINPSFKLVGLTMIMNLGYYLALQSIQKIYLNLEQLWKNHYIFLNSSPDAKIHSITLDPDSINSYNFLAEKKELKSIKNAINESVYFIFSDMTIENKY